MKRICSLALGLGILASATVVRADNVDFQSFTPGKVVTQAGFGNGIFTVTATDSSAFGPQTATVIDTDVNRANQTDLEYPFSGGNLKTTSTMQTRLRKVLVVQSAVNAANYTKSDNSLDLKFSRRLKEFGFDVLDMEADNAAASTIDFIQDGVILQSVPFSAFTKVGTPVTSPFYNRGVVYGENSANRIAAIKSNKVGGEFDEVVFNFVDANPNNSSNAATGIDSLNYKLSTVPEPAAAGLLLGLPALLARRRRQA